MPGKRNPRSSEAQKPLLNTETPLLQVIDLRAGFHIDQGLLRAVDGVSLEIGAGETLGLVGESGSGKSVTAYSILKLLPVPAAEYLGGEIRFDGRNLLALPEAEMRSVRGRDISLIFQEPMSSLNPIMTIGKQITEVIVEHRRISHRAAAPAAIEMLRRAGVSSPEARMNEYPHQLSGGMLQRVMIAMALVCKPRLLIADEPTTALDVTIQAQILDLLAELKDELRMSVLLITHDLGIVASICDRVAVMYAGKIVEMASTRDLFSRPAHPYTRSLFASLPSRVDRNRELPTIPGAIPSPLKMPSGCRFRTRCYMAETICLEEPALSEVGPSHVSSCHFGNELAGESGDKKWTRY